jgi:hypothetical protein
VALEVIDMTSEEQAKPGDAQDREQGQEPTRLRVRVVDHSKDGRPAVNIRLPIGVVKFGLNVAQAFSPDVRKANLDWDSISAMIQEGQLGKIVEVEDEAQQKTIEVWIE